jgi:hypothetical protein
MHCYGYCFDQEGRYGPPIRLADQHAIIQFIRENGDAPQLMITDAGDNQLLLMRNGVDLFNDLDRIGISLQAVLNHIREEMVDEGSSSSEKPEWERLYDQIGLSPGEIRMRQRVKAACRAAKTVADVAEIVRGTYFDAHFLTPDGKKWYRFFDEEDYSATLMIKDENEKWIDEPEKAVLSPRTNVRHLRSSEDIHTFELLDV